MDPERHSPLPFEETNPANIEIDYVCSDCDFIGYNIVALHYHTFVCGNKYETSQQRKFTRLCDCPYSCGAKCELQRMATHINRNHASSKLQEGNRTIPPNIITVSASNDSTRAPRQEGPVSWYYFYKTTMNSAPDIIAMMWFLCFLAAFAVIVLLT
jgi:hypothetical protein